MFVWILVILILGFGLPESRAESFFVEGALDPVVHTLVQKGGAQARGETYFGQSQFLTIGYKISSFSVAFVASQADLDYRYDSIRKKMSQNRLGLALGYSVSRAFRVGLDLLSVNRKVAPSVGSELSMKGFETDLFVVGKIYIYGGFYGLLRVSKVLYSSVRAKSSNLTNPDFSVSGHSLKLGAGYSF